MVSSQLGIDAVRGARQRVAFVLGVVVVEWLNRHAMRFLGVAARCAAWTGRALRAVCFHVGMGAGASTAMYVVIGVIAMIGLPLLLGALLSYLLKLGLVAVGVLTVIFVSL